MTAAVESIKSTPARLAPGVVTGEDYRSLVAACKAGGFALPAVNVSGTNSVNAVLEAAAAAKSDVIVQLSNGGARFFAGEGLKDEANARVLGAVSAPVRRVLDWVALLLLTAFAACWPSTPGGWPSNPTILAR